MNLQIIFFATIYKWTFNFVIMKLPGTGKHYYLSDKFMHRIFSFCSSFFCFEEKKKLVHFFGSFLCANKEMNRKFERKI